MYTRCISIHFCKCNQKLVKEDLKIRYFMCRTTYEISALEYILMKKEITE